LVQQQHICYQDNDIENVLLDYWSATRSALRHHSDGVDWT